MKGISIKIKQMFSVILSLLTYIILLGSIILTGCITTKTYTWPNGDKYIGEWKGNKKHGKGTYFYANGNKYIGGYKDGKKHGYGIYYFGEFTYQGEWINDKPVTDGTGPHAAYGHYLWGEEYGHKQQYRKAIIEYNRALSKSHNKWIAFSCYNNLGIIYLHIGNDEKTYYCFHKAIQTWPAIAYYPYMGLSSLAYKHGKLEECAEYRQKAFDLVQSKEYEKIERQYFGYDTDTLKKWVTIFYDSSQIQLSFSKLKHEYSRKNYTEVERLANEILNKKYHAGLGISIEGTFISSVSEEGIAALNGIVEGDQLLEIDGTMISDPRTAITELANLYDKFGESIKVKIRRKDRGITMLCHLYYPELETAQRMLNVARQILKSGNIKDYTKDEDPPQIIVLKPKAKRGIRLIRENFSEFVIIAGDNIGVKEVLIDEINCIPAKISLLEKNLLEGDVRKYTARVPAAEGTNTHTIKAIDTSGNTTTKLLSIIFNPGSIKIPEDLYENCVAVVIGIDKYTSWPSLEFSVSDAKAVKEKLRDLGFHHIIELVNHEATRLQILRLLGDRLPKMLDEDDCLLVYFAGHGQTETFQYEDRHLRIINEKEGYIIPVDGDMENYRGTAISMTAIHKASKNYKAKHILYVFDSCYSGLGLKRAGGTKKADEYIKKISAMKAVQIITAGGENEQVGEEKGHGIFTRYFLMALEGKADLDDDGFIVASEIGTYIRPTVSRKTQNAQTPKFGWILGEGDFIFENLDK